MNKKICILTNGCPENRIDSARMQEFFKQNGYIITSKLRQADIIIFNTCALTKESENASINIIKQIGQVKRPSAELIVSGCITKINKELLRTVYQCPIFGSDDLQKLDEIFNPKINSKNIYANFLLNQTKFINRFRWTAVSLGSKGSLGIILKLIEKGRDKHDRLVDVCNPHTFCIKVATGCLGNCSFCAVRISRGKLKSKPIDNIIKEFQEGLNKGYKDFALIGTEVGAYGKDLGINLVVLLEELINKPGDYKIRLRNAHPKFLIEMMPQLRRIFKSGKISFLASAAESGNNRILKLMNRGYNIEDFKGAIQTLNQEFPQIRLRTQLMVGFPSETEEEFQDTARLLEELHFDFAEVYRFQARPGTEAAKMKQQVPVNVAKRRSLRLLVKALFNERKRKNENKRNL